MIRRINKKSEKADACSGVHGYHKGDMDGEIISINRVEYMLEVHPVDEVNDGWNTYQREKRMERMNPRLRRLLKFFRTS